MPVMRLDIAHATKEQKDELVKELVPVFAKIIKMPEETIYVFINEYGSFAILNKINVV